MTSFVGVLEFARDHDLELAMFFGRFRTRFLCRLGDIDDRELSLSDCPDDVLRRYPPHFIQC